MCNKYKSPHDRALIAFGSDVLAILEDHNEWDGDTFQQLSERLRDRAHNFGLSTATPQGTFIVIPRERFRNPLEL